MKGLQSKMFVLRFTITNSQFFKTVSGKLSDNQQLNEKLQGTITPEHKVRKHRKQLCKKVTKVPFVASHMVCTELSYFSDHLTHISASHYVANSEAVIGIILLGTIILFLAGGQVIQFPVGSFLALELDCYQIT